MEYQRNPLLGFSIYCHGKSTEELRQSLVLTSLELESVRLKAQEERRMRDEELVQLKDLLNKAMKERDEAHDKNQKLLLEKLLLQQQQQKFQFHQTGPLSGVSSIEDEPRRGIDSKYGFSSSDSDESIVSSPVIDPNPQLHPPLSLPLPAVHQTPLLDQEPEIFHLVKDMPLPKKGKLLQAVMQAGPILQNLLLAGPLPQWRHPPPPLDTYQIPPPPLVIPSPPTPPCNILHQDYSPNFTSLNKITMNNCSGLDNKRALYDSSDSPAKYQRIALH